MKFTVKRSEWLRGEGSVRSMLFRNSDNHRCCLGFLGNACGISDQDMRGKSTPLSLYNTSESEGKKFPEPMLEKNGGVVDTLMDINDTYGMSAEERERRLRETFSVIGIEVEFVD